MPQPVKYLRRREINDDRWDDCVQKWGMAYQLTAFLDRICEWDAVVLGDYEALMPLPHRQKALIKYVYPPWYAAQLGICGNVDDATAEAIIAGIPKKFSYLHLRMNDGNPPVEHPDWKINRRKNYVLSLRRRIEIIRQGYGDTAKKNLAQAHKNGLDARFGVDPDVAMAFHKSYYGKYLLGSGQDEFEMFKKALPQWIKDGLAFTIGIYNGEKLIHTGIWLKDNRRVYNLITGPTAESRKLQAAYLMIDAVAEKFAGSVDYLDFEGSDIPDVETFFKRFRPELRHYNEILINRLPKVIRWIKR